MRENTKIGLVLVGSFLTLTAVGFGAWGIDIALSGPRGAANVYKQNQDANNRTSAAQTWQQSYNDVQRDITNLTTIKQMYKTSDPQGFIVTSQTACNGDVAHYNGLQTQPLLKDWKPDSLPWEFDATTCN